MSYVHIESKHYSPENIKINRNNKDFPQTVSVENSNGITLFTCTQEWSDKQILDTIKLANHAFKLGRMRGKSDAFEEVEKHASDKRHFISLN